MISTEKINEECLIWYNDGIKFYECYKNDIAEFCRKYMEDKNSIDEKDIEYISSLFEALDIFMKNQYPYTYEFISANIALENYIRDLYNKLDDNDDVIDDDINNDLVIFIPEKN